MKKEQEKETKEKVDFALEVGKFLPETKQKVEYYKDIMKAEKGLIDALEKAIKNKDLHKHIYYRKNKTKYVIYRI